MRVGTETSVTAFEALARQFLGRASPTTEPTTGAGLDDRVLDSIDLAHHNEGLIALENLCSNLHDFEVAVTDEERAALVTFADAWRLGDKDRRLIELLSSA